MTSEKLYVVTTKRKEGCHIFSLCTQMLWKEFMRENVRKEKHPN